MFEQINKHWCSKIMKPTNNKPNVKANCFKTRQQEFIKFNAQMDKIQKNLEDYLEEKRGEFPRFYFVSNDELLQILANASDIKAIEKHINKCFDNIVKLSLN